MAVPRVSVVMTVFNGGVHLREAVESVLKQTFSDFEFIIVDNASTDGSLSLLKAFADPRIRLIENPVNLGQTRALNLGIREAAGVYLARMDADDVSAPDRFAAQFSFLEKNPAVAVVGSWHDEIDERGRRLKRMRYPTHPADIKCHLLSDGDLTRRCFAHPTAFFRTAVLRELNGYDESVTYAQDYELWTRLSARHAISNIGRSLLSYRVSKKSTSNLHRAEMTQELDRIVSANIFRIWPGIGRREHRILLQMLRNLPLEDPISLAQLGRLFDEFFERSFSPEKPPARASRVRDRIKIYYLPRRISKDPLRSLLQLGEYSLCHPGLWLDSKMYKNILKPIVRP